MVTEPAPSLKPADLAIPPRPQVLMTLMEETRRAEPDVRRIARAIQSDPGLSGVMLKTVNSPAFGISRKASSVAQAIAMLGLANVSSIATGLALRQSMARPSGGALERFWDTSERWL